MAFLVFIQPGVFSKAQVFDVAKGGVIAPVERLRLGVMALMGNYDADEGLWQTEGWWNAANSVTVLGETAAFDAKSQFSETLQNTFLRAQKRFPQFRNEFYDDEGWWALAWIQAYDVTHRREYLDMADSIFGDMSAGWDNTCGGGIWWKKDRHYKNAIANELFLSVAAHLAARENGQRRRSHLTWAKREWSWFHESGMINDEHLVNDGLNANCKNNGRNTWTYNQGVIVGGLVELSAVTGNPEFKREARLIASAAIAKLTDANQVLHDRTEPKCSADTVQFKGIFLRNVTSLYRATQNEEYASFIRANAGAIWNSARTTDNNFACRWSGPPQNDGAAATTSALDALFADANLTQGSN